MTHITLLDIVPDSCALGCETEQPAITSETLDSTLVDLSKANGGNLPEHLIALYSIGGQCRMAGFLLHAMTYSAASNRTNGFYLLEQMYNEVIGGIENSDLARKALEVLQDDSLLVDKAMICMTCPFAKTLLEIANAQEAPIPGKQRVFREDDHIRVQLLFRRLQAISAARDAREKERSEKCLITGD